MSYFMDQKKKYLKGESSKYNVQDDSDERVFEKESNGSKGLSNDAFSAQKRLNEKWADK